MKANNAETPDSSNAADTFKWVAAFVLAAAAVVGNYLYGEINETSRCAEQPQKLHSAGLDG